MNRRQLRPIGALLCATLALTGIAAAEQIEIGAHGGISIPNIRGSQTDIFTRGFTSRQGPFFGIFADIGLATHFSLVAELNYTSQGGKRNGWQPITSLPPELAPLFPDPLQPPFANFNNETILDYVEIPLMIRVSTAGRVRVFANAGPYVGYLVRARAVTAGTSALYFDEGHTIPVIIPPDTQPLTIPLDANTDVMDSLKKWNFGLAFGGGLRYAAGPGDLILEAHFQLGLTTIQKDVTVSGNSKTGAVVISLGYAFGLK